ncbi:MAG: DUF4867 family protein [Lachnospiraceae bacterium]|nr:DUF4867 family protein [Lachnospiraceae bacterium]
MKIQKVTDPSFAAYGRIVEAIDFTQLLDTLVAQTPKPEDVVYEPSVSCLEELPVMEKLQTVCYGELPIQIGYCNGHNTKLNAVEYHRSSEIDIAADDLILLLGKEQDITSDYTYDTSKIEAFVCPKGVGVELYATTLHYAPCNATPDGFRCVIVLPKDTNLPLDEAHAGYEDALITAKNKWLIGHAEGNLPEGTHIGLIGKNIDVTE